MNIVIGIIVVIGILVAIILVVALFVKKEYAIERDLVIRKPKQDVFNYVKYLKNQDHYSKWVMTDPNMKKTFKGTDGTAGFVYAWDSENKNAGKGEQEIISLKEGERVDIEVRFEKPFEGLAHTPIALEHIGENQTRVRWGMKGKSKYPMNIMNLFIPNMLGKDLEISLNTLKNILENQTTGR
jgi:hypothetical protein